MKGTTRQADVTIGLDLGDKRCQACVLDAAGEVVDRRSVATTKVAMEGVFDEYMGCLLVMEVGTHSPWVSRLFKARGFKVITANPRQVRLITESQHKTDHFDAEMLARLGRADPEMLALSEELAVVTAREADLIARVDTGEAGAVWQSMRKALADFRTAQRREDGAGAASALREMERLVDQGAADYRAWAELLTTIETRRRLVDTERRRLEASQQTITTDRAMLLVAALVDAVRRHVDDRRVLDAIGLEVERIVTVERAVTTGECE